MQQKPAVEMMIYHNLFTTAIPAAMIFLWKGIPPSAMRFKKGLALQMLPGLFFGPFACLCLAGPCICLTGQSHTTFGQPRALPTPDNPV